MAHEKVKQFFEEIGLEQRVKVLAQSSATVEQAAKAIGCEPERIAKTMSFLLENRAILIVIAGDARVDNKKYKAVFGEKARMIPYDLVESYVGHEPGGVCPFAINPNVRVYMDASLRRFETVYPAGGDDYSAIELSVSELKKYSAAVEWVDVCRGWRADED